MFKKGKGYKKLIDKEPDSEGTEEWKKEMEIKFSKGKEEEKKKKAEEEAKQVKERMNIKRRKLFFKK
jgi:hypothetical protein